MEEFFDKVTDAIKDILGKTPLEEDLDNAINNEEWLAPNTLLRSLAEKTHHDEDSSRILKAIWENLRSAPRNWRKIQKTLLLVDMVIRTGSQRALAEIRNESFKIRILTDFSYEDSGMGYGNGVRETATEIVRILGDIRLLEAEREKARGYMPKCEGYSDMNNQIGETTNEPSATHSFYEQSVYTDYRKPLATRQQEHTPFVDLLDTSEPTQCEREMDIAPAGPPTVADLLDFSEPSIQSTNTNTASADVFVDITLNSSQTSLRNGELLL